VGSSAVGNARAVTTTLPNLNVICTSLLTVRTVSHASKRSSLARKKTYISQNVHSILNSPVRERLSHPSINQPTRDSAIRRRIQDLLQLTDETPSSSHSLCHFCHLGVKYFGGPQHIYSSLPLSLLWSMHTKYVRTTILDRYKDEIDSVYEVKLQQDLSSRGWVATATEVRRDNTSPADRNNKFLPTT